MNRPTITIGAPIPLLTKWGVTPDADLAYRTLATCGPVTAGDLVRSLGMARGRVDRAVAELHDVGAVSYVFSTPSLRDLVWRARPPAAVLQNLRRRRRRSAASSRDNLVAPPVPVSVELGPGMRHLPDRKYTGLRLAQLANGARHETLTFNPELTFDPASLKAGAITDRIVLSRGVSMRIIGKLPPDPDRLVPYGGESSRSRKSYREMADVPMKLIIIDRQVALFPVDPHDYERGYLEIVQTPVVQSLVETFERHWAAARDPLESNVPGFALTPREEIMIGLLVHGHTDASAALEMQISERTISTMLRSLMDRVGVENRFQLGVALGSLRAAPNPPGMSAQATPNRPEEQNH